MPKYWLISDRNNNGTGQGMNSKAFEAFDPQLGGTLAVKEIPKNNFGNDPSVFFSEAQIMFASAHPNVVPVQYACESTSEISIAMPLFPRGSLAAQIKSGPLGVAAVLDKQDRRLRVR